jgi:hypothetical protein
VLEKSKKLGVDMIYKLEKFTNKTEMELAFAKIPAGTNFLDMSGIILRRTGTDDKAFAACIEKIPASITEVDLP